MEQTRGAAYHTMTQGKVERYHRSNEERDNVIVLGALRARVSF
jgi:hypothetical protein